MLRGIRYSRPYSSPLEPQYTITGITGIDMNSPYGWPGSMIVMAVAVVLACMLILAGGGEAMQSLEGPAIEGNNSQGPVRSTSVSMPTQDTGICSLPNGPVTSNQDDRWVLSAESAAPRFYHEWIEWAEDTGVVQATEFNASWHVPRSPPGSRRFETIYLFHGISPQGGDNGIVQAVLEWNRPDTGLYWTATAWGANSSHADVGRRIRASEGDLLTGSILWNESHQQWYVQLTDLTTGEISSVWTDAFTSNTNLEVYISLEGYNFRGDRDLPGNTVFSNITLMNSKDPVSINLSPRYGKIAEQKLTHLRVEIEDDPLQVTLHTPD